MKVVRKTILDKINEEIDKDPDNIVRIELNSEEFEELLKLVPLNCSSVSKHLITDYPQLISSYIVYEGTCIQTHESYE